MRIKYFPETDTLIINFKDEPVFESEHLEDLDVVVDYNRNNEIIKEAIILAWPLGIIAGITKLLLVSLKNKKRERNV